MQSIRRLPPRLLIAAAYLLVALYVTSPLLTTLSTRFIGHDSGDAYEMARHIWWYKTALQNGADIFQHALLGYPDGFPAVQLWANPLQFFPAWLFAYVMPLASAYNISILLHVTLNGWAMYVLARRRLGAGSHFPPFVAGLIFMIFPTMQGHLFAGHPGLLAQWTLPIFINCLFEYADFGGSRRFLLALLFFWLSALGHSMQAVYALMPLLALFLLARLARRDYVGALRAAAVGVGGALLLLLFLAPVFASVLEHRRSVEAGGYLRYSIDLLGLASPSFANPFWQDIAGHSARVLGTNLGAGASYIGVLGGLLALIGILRRRAARWWLLTAGVAWLLALGPALKVYDQPLTLDIAGYEAVLPLPFALLMELPLLELARAPGRFMFLFAAMFALLAGFGAAEICRSAIISRRHWGIRLALALLCVFLLVEDYKLFAEFPSLPAEIPQAIHNLSKRRDIRAVFNVPYDNLLVAKEAMYLQTAHGKPLIAGHDTRVTPVDPARLALLARFRPGLLVEARADIVIVNKARALENAQLDLLQRAGQWLGEPISEDQRFAIYETPRAPNRNALLHSSQMDEGAHTTYIYKEQPGWLEFNVELEAANRKVQFYLNDAPLDALRVMGRTPVSIALPLARRGYHTLRIALDPPCPPRLDASLLQCQVVAVENVFIRIVSSGAMYNPIRIEDGIVLAGHLLPAPQADEALIRLWWRFEADRSPNDVRFVHVLDENGLPVRARPPDRSLGAVAAGSEVTETVRLDISALPPGEYQVLTGWYALPDAIRYDVLTNVAGAQNDTVVLGTVHVAG